MAQLAASFLVLLLVRNASREVLSLLRLELTTVHIFLHVLIEV